MNNNQPTAKGTGETAVVLLSGGLDSAITAAIARADGYVCHALSFDYGQRHRAELDAAQLQAGHLGVASHRTVRIDYSPLLCRGGDRPDPGFGGSALTNEIEVPKDRDEQQMAAGIPVTYVPARNTLFLSYALALAETLGCTDIFIGVNAVDYSGYPDCRPRYIEAFETMANLATKAAVEGRRMMIHTPLIHLRKVEIIRRGLDLGVDFGLTHSCYDPSPEAGACGRCDACLLRNRAFRELGMVDPALPR